MAEVNLSNDVSRPGQSLPSSSGRPTIVGNRTLLKDPMISVDPQPEKSEPIAQRTRELSPQVSAVAAATEKEVVTEEKTPQQPAAEAVSVEATDSIGQDDTAGRENNRHQGGINLEEKQAQADQARQQKFDKLVEDKTYFVSVGERAHGSSVFMKLALGFGLLVAMLILVDLAIDTQLIKTSFKPPISFFNNK